MREHRDVHHVVDAGPLDRGAALVGGPERRAAGAAESIDANPDGHVLPPTLGNASSLSDGGAAGIRGSATPDTYIPAEDRVISPHVEPASRRENRAMTATQTPTATRYVYDFAEGSRDCARCSAARARTSPR